MMSFLLKFVYLLVFIQCGFTVNFDSGRTVSVIQSDEVVEASGIALSRRHADIIYTLNDSGGTATVYAININDGTTQAKLEILGATNCDWEDIAVGIGPNDDSYIFIGDIGGNTALVCQKLYRIKEPESLVDSSLPIDSTMTYTWEDDNCETLMVDPEGQVYIVSKVAANKTPLLYKIPASSWGQSTAVFLPKSSGSPVSITSNDESPVAGDISVDGDEILIKTYDDIFYYYKNASESYATALQRTPQALPYIPEPQGESIAWALGGEGFYTLSEHAKQPIIYHKRLNGSSANNMSSSGESMNYFHNGQFIFSVLLAYLISHIQFL